MLLDLTRYAAVLHFTSHLHLYSPPRLTSRPTVRFIASRHLLSHLPSTTQPAFVESSQPKQTKANIKMCKDHLTIYTCSHMRYLELESCFFFSYTFNKCLARPHEMVEHYAEYKCRDCRSKREKKERDEWREKNRERFRYEV
jgi:hypothetical protein